jgi:hypothetical protein
MNAASRFRLMASTIKNNLKTRIRKSNRILAFYLGYLISYLRPRRVIQPRFGVNMVHLFLIFDRWLLDDETVEDEQNGRKEEQNHEQGDESPSSQ